MDNSETLATLGTQDIGRRQSKHTKKEKKTRHNTERVVSSFCLLLGTRRVTDIYIDKFDKSVKGIRH